MPEGPEIRRAADALAEAVLGEPLQRVEFGVPALRRYQCTLAGQRIVSITPHGKALLTRFDGGQTLYSHNQLYGVWKIVDAGQRPSTSRSLRVALETSRKAILLYSASDVTMWDSARIAEHPFLAGLGPDVLDEALRPAEVEARLRDPRFAGRRLSSLLLDQSFLAGMGNYLRSEVLHRASLAPQHRPRDLAPAQRAALADALLAVPRDSYRSRGRRYAAVEGLSGTGAAGFRFRVFDREGEPCEGCGAAIVREEHGGRRLYWCARCQD